MLNTKRLYENSTSQKVSRKRSIKIVNTNLIADFFKTTLGFLANFPLYIYWRGRVVIVYFAYTFFAFANIFAYIKSYFVRRMFWGRGGFYKSSFHLAVISLTVFLLITNLANKVSLVQALNQEESLIFSYASDGNKDVLQQGNTLKSITAVDPGFPEFSVRTYTVREGDTLATIAKDFEIKKETIKWANSKILSPFNDEIKKGWELNIPEMDGVLYTVASGENLDSVISKTENSDKASVIELNRLLPPEYKLKEGQILFVPNAKLKPPPKPKPVNNYSSSSAYRRPGVDYETAKKALDAMPAGTFGNPLRNCPGYKYSRGLTAYHHGVDLARKGDCWIVAAAAGTVRVAGYHYLSGFYVTIDHGSGIETNYFHGRSGTFKVKAGQHVEKGQSLMMMGSTGRSTGQHLHLELVVGGRYMNPGDYIPY